MGLSGIPETGMLQCPAIYDHDVLEQKREFITGECRITRTAFGAADLFASAAGGTYRRRQIHLAAAANPAAGGF
jgi:hypothetical protein